MQLTKLIDKQGPGVDSRDEFKAERRASSDWRTPHEPAIA